MGVPIVLLPVLTYNALAYRTLLQIIWQIGSQKVGVFDPPYSLYLLLTCLGLHNSSDHTNSKDYLRVDG